MRMVLFVVVVLFIINYFGEENVLDLQILVVYLNADRLCMA